jgi:hypothetical protein
MSEGRQVKQDILTRLNRAVKKLDGTVFDDASSDVVERITNELESVTSPIQDNPMRPGRVKTP